MKPWKYYATILASCLTLYFLAQAIFLFETEWHFANLYLSGIFFLFTLGFWLDYKEVKTETLKENKTNY